MKEWMKEKNESRGCANEQHFRKLEGSKVLKLNGQAYESDFRDKHGRRKIGRDIRRMCDQRTVSRHSAEQAYSEITVTRRAAVTPH